MNKLKQNSTGFGMITVIIAFVLVLIGIASWRIVSSHTEETNQVIDTANTVKDTLDKAQLNKR